MMTSINDFLEKQFNAIQKQKSEEMRTSIEKLKRELKTANALAEERKLIIESLVFESSAKREKAFTNSEAFNSFRKQILQILGVKQIGISDDEILIEINEYKMSTKFWRQKYLNLCTDIETLAGSLEEVGHQTDVNIVLNRMKMFIKQIDDLKSNYSKLSKQMKDKESYCETLIRLRDNLCSEMDSLKVENSIISRNRDSLNEKCFLQNKIIEVFEELVWQRNHSSKLIQRNNTLTNELKKYKIHMNSGNISEETSDLFRESPNRMRLSSYSSDSIFNTPKSKKRQYSLRSGSKDTSISDQYHSLSSVLSDSSAKRRQRSLQQNSSDEKQLRKQPERQVKSSGKPY